MVSELELSVLLLLEVPFQLATCQPVPGVAESEMRAPERYCPFEQPLEFAGLATGSLPVPVWESVKE